MNAPSAIVKLQNYVNHLDSETCCKRINDIKIVDAEEVLLFHQAECAW